ncbi:MAG: EF-P lysine aminoacylase EpmA [Candidatus Rhabdochlamydia sp.]
MISLQHLLLRAEMLATVRTFFSTRNVIEVDTPLLSKSAPIDSHIDVMTVTFASRQKAYLHTSPEYAMKRLLCHYPIDMYQLSHVFREEEMSSRHNPEFTLIEWYRNHFSLPKLIEETLELIQLFLEPLTPQFLSFQELFLKFLHFDPFLVTKDELYQQALKTSSLPSPSSLSWDLDTWLYYYMGCIIEPQLKGLYVIDAFPPSWAALAKIKQEGNITVANRFEIFFNGIELANGFEELQDPFEQRIRLQENNKERVKQGKPPLPLDEHFLAALEKGLPSCCGVAAGFDRLLMLHTNASSLKEVLPLSWDDL